MEREPQPASRGSLPRPYSRAAARLICAFALLMAVALGALGWTNARLQKQRLARYRPVPATVLGTRIEAVRGEHDDLQEVAYRPVVEYRYSVGWSEYTSQSVTPLPELSSRAWAELLLARFNGATTVTAWYDPERPAEAFLVRYASFAPYLFIFVALALASLTLWLAMRDGVLSRDELLYPARPYVRSDLTRRWKALLAVAALWHVGGWATWLDARAFGLPLALDARPLVAFLVYEILGLGPLLYGLFFLVRARAARDVARDQIDAVRFLRSARVDPAAGPR